MIKLKKSIQNYNKNHLVFIVICFFTYLIWAIVIPYDDAPDEYMRMDIVKYIVDNGTLPNGHDTSLITSVWGFSYAFLPYLAQMISAAIVKFCVVFLNFGDTYLYIAGRFASVIFSTLTVYFTLNIGDFIFKSKFKWIFVSTLAFLPQFIFLSAYMNNESLAILSAVAIIYFWLTGMDNGWGYKSCVGLAASISVCLLSYYNAYGFILMSVPFFILTLYSYYKNQGLEKNGIAKIVLQRTSLIIIIIICLAGWWFIRNFILYDGDILGMKTTDAYGELYAIDELKPSLRDTPEHNNYSLSYMLFDMKWIVLTRESFIGKFGYMAYRLSTKLYNVYYLILGLGVLANLFMFAKSKVKKVTPVIWNLCLLLASIIPIFLSVYRSYYTDFQPQGRYIIYIVIPLAVFVGKGYERLASFIKQRLLKNKGNHIVNAIPYLYCIAYISLSYYSFFNYLLPIYIV